MDSNCVKYQDKTSLFGDLARTWVLASWAPWLVWRYDLWSRSRQKLCEILFRFNFAVLSYAPSTDLATCTLWPWPKRYNLGSRSSTIWSWTPIIWNIQIHHRSMELDLSWSAYGFGIHVCVYCDLDLRDNNDFGPRSRHALRPSTTIVCCCYFFWPHYVTGHSVWGRNLGQRTHFHSISIDFYIVKSGPYVTNFLPALGPSLSQKNINDRRQPWSRILYPFKVSQTSTKQ